MTSPKKYSQKYFEERIATLQAEIKEHLPPKDRLAGNLFLPLVAGIETAVDGLEVANDLKKKLETAKRKHSDDAPLLEDCEQVLKDSKAALEQFNEAATNAGLAIVQDSSLVLNLFDVRDQLLECTVLVQGTPKKLSEWVVESPNAHGKLLDAFLGGQRVTNHSSNSDGLSLIEAFFNAGGPSHGNYGPALVLYDQLQSEIAASDDMQDSDLVQRLALAVALELATPIPIFHDETKVVDPIERFRHYAKLADPKDNALDVAFYGLSVWELRKVVDSNATEQDLQWGRDFLQNYRPDQITMADQKWRYVASVRTDVSYRHPDHEFNTYQELISAGGECGPRAFFGRFVCKAWGIPTWGVRQPGHAAMARYTQDSGWKVILGADWSYSWWDEDRYCGNDVTKSRMGPDFLEETRARTAAAYVHHVVWLECLAEVMGETIEEHFVSSKFWRNLALAIRKCLARQFLIDETATCKASGNFEELSEARTRLAAASIEKEYIGDSRASNAIVIPAASFVDPKKTDKQVMILDSYSGGKQLHLEHTGAVEYELPTSLVAGTYTLSAKVVNVHRMQQPLVIEIQEDELEDFEFVHLPQEVEVPYTKGYWQDTPSIRIDLGGSGGKLKISRNDPCWGLSIKEFVITPTTA